MKNKGFTLIELMIVLAIIAIVAMIAYPSYQHYVRKSYRSEAIEALLGIELAQEHYRSHNVQYGTLDQVWGLTSTANGRYTLAVSNVSPTSFTVTATAVGDQANDKEGGVSCAILVVAVSNTVSTSTPAACW